MTEDKFERLLAQNLTALMLGLSTVVAGSDWVIDIGPSAGEEGSRIVAAGTPVEVAKSSASRTAPYLARFMICVEKLPKRLTHFAKMKDRMILL